ncbi:MAG: Tat pathway signal protein [Boseongicola sp.]|nr:Tat pathway signal protein [Boseongicola sp.]NNJ68300.1 Tat pathway signal protein [Boseongicola sp.]
MMNRRMFLAGTAAAAGARLVPVVSKPGGRRILTLVYDKSLGMMRAIDRVVR